VIIAIDGPAGAGKSSVARALAAALGFRYLDTGAMYRAVALAAERAGAGADPGAIARGAGLSLGERVLLDGEDVSDAIRTPAVSEAASRLAADPAVRAAMVAAQRRLLRTGDWVAEGRDIGTVVAPAAELKVFLTASAQERARRRAVQLGLDVAAVLADQQVRDARDAGREHAPLAPAPGAVELDTTGLSLDEVVARIVALARGRAARSARSAAERAAVGVCRSRPRGIPSDA
jgi:cytidylate kinase